MFNIEKKDLFGSKVAGGIMFAAVCIMLAKSGFHVGQWLAGKL